MADEADAGWDYSSTESPPITELPEHYTELDRTRQWPNCQLLSRNFS